MQVVIVGAGLAGLSLASKLRALEFSGKIAMFGDEPTPPYDRPPLSKGYLSGATDLHEIALRPNEFFTENEISLHTGCRVTAIDRATRKIRFGSEEFSFDQLGLTTGVVPRGLPENVTGGLTGVFPLRTLKDADYIREAFETARSVVVVGGGYIGLEIAATAAKRRLEVTVIEAAPRILQRVAGDLTADYFRDLHQKNGVTVLEGTSVARLIGDNRATGAILDNGTEIAADLIVVGVGITPDVALAEAAGLEIDNGIKTDLHGRTCDPNIWAAGDCASFPLRGRQTRLECVQNAIQQAELVAENMMGATKTYMPIPWFWSDQYDTRLQIAGLSTSYDRIVSRAGTKDGGWSHWYYIDDQLLAIDAINDPQAFMAGKRLLEMGRSPAPEIIQNPGTKLKALLKG